jgi:dephospho-CoA kinase
LLGGIASGKSTVARLLAGERGLVIDADAIVSELYAEPGVRRELSEQFGPRILDADGALDRAALGRAVFGDAGARKRLEDWIHPRVRERILARLEDARASGVPRVVLDVPLLLENDAQHHLAGLCRTLVFVDAPADAREARARANRGWPSGEVSRREAAQMPLAEKRGRAHHLITNDQGPEGLARAVGELGKTLDAANP